MKPLFNLETLPAGLGVESLRIGDLSEAMEYLCRVIEPQIQDAPLAQYPEPTSNNTAVGLADVISLDDARRRVLAAGQPAPVDQPDTHNLMSKNGQSTAHQDPTQPSTEDTSPGATIINLADHMQQPLHDAAGGSQSAQVIDFQQHQIDNARRLASNAATEDMTFAEILQKAQNG